MAKINGPNQRIPTARPAAAKAPVRSEPKAAAPSPAPAQLPRTGWSEPARAPRTSETASVRTPNPRLAHAQPPHDPIFAGASRPAVVARKSLPEPHPRQGHETDPRQGLTTSPRRGISLK